MPQVLASLNAVTADTVGSVLSFGSTKTKYAMQYIVTMSGGGPINLFFEASMDGMNFSSIGSSVSLGASANAFTSGGTYPVLYLRARVTGVPAGATVTALVSVAD